MSKTCVLNIPYLTFCCVVSLSIFTSCAVFWWAVGQVKIQTMSKNTKPYCTMKCLIGGLLSNTPSCCLCGWISLILFTRNAWQKYAKRNGIGTGNPANWLVNSSRTKQTGFWGFDQAITAGTIYFPFRNRKKIFRWSKSHINSSFSL